MMSGVEKGRGGVRNTLPAPGGGGGEGGEGGARDRMFEESSSK